jgi:hypothetical protein
MSDIQDNLRKLQDRNIDSNIIRKVEEVLNYRDNWDNDGSTALLESTKDALIYLLCNTCIARMTNFDFNPLNARFINFTFGEYECFLSNFKGTTSKPGDLLSVRKHRDEHNVGINANVIVCVQSDNVDKYCSLETFCSEWKNGKSN